MIRAIVRDGTIRPLEPLPTDWSDGQELVVQRLDVEETGSWCDEVQKAMSGIPPEDHARVTAAIDEHRREAKMQMQNEMGM